VRVDDQGSSLYDLMKILVIMFVMGNTILRYKEITWHGCDGSYLNTLIIASLQCIKCPLNYLVVH